MRYAFWVLGLALLTRGLWAEAVEKDARAQSKSGPVYIPTLDVVRDKCTKEHPKKCLKRRCVPAFSRNAKDMKRLERLCAPNWSKCLPFANQPTDPWPDDTDIKHVKKAFGDDWQAARDAMLAAWEVLLYGAATSKMNAFVDLFEYPTIFTLETGNIRNMWVRWEVCGKEELKRVLFYILRPLVKKRMLCGRRCSTILTYDMSGYLFSSSFKIYFDTKKLTEGANKGRYQLIFNRIIVQSDAFFKDVGKTRHELKRRGVRSPARPYP